MKTDSGFPEALTRREAIRRVSTLFGGAALVGQSAMLASCAAPQDAENGLFSASEIALLDEIAETILPETDTPGARAAGVGAFMALMVADTYYERDRAIFREGLAAIDAASRETSGAGFASATAADRQALLEALDVEQYEYMRNKSPEEPAHFFRMMKELALLGYFTSEIGYMQAMRYVETPGRFDPCAPHAPGEKIWADHA
ncbi:MAG: gluconate 2-dehydrogenase subunit 3 family protein [Gammaproteobacteria bacterium]|nr:gluconate 2-dehydrogenase subunit 3 family protein [Gammaproteobacteria bacterium]MCY3687908.1 gluconate 2-dehydrogenase subunit 3 family protein [Gammaproteobacteria bacterium]MDE0508300.1 gluconate 2-dehydrogenase subunit 3 family protein [Gammaproteobacteria bacterium]